MAAQGKKKQKMKGTKVSLNDFLGDEHNVVQAKPLDWAAEMDSVDAEYDLDVGKSVIDRSKLPTAPKAARGPDVDMNRIPSSPPYTAFIGNLPYEATDESIADFFRQLNVANVRLPQDKGRLRGFGYVEFEDRQSLIDALAMNEETFSGRKIRIDLAGQNQQQNERSGGDDRDRGDPTRSEGDWRSRDATQDPDFNRDRGERDRGYRKQGDGYGSRDGRGYDDRGSRGGGFDTFERGSMEDYNRGFSDRFGNRDRGYDDRGPPRNRDRYDDRGPPRGGGFDSFDRDSRDRGYDDRGSRGGGGGGGYDRYDRGPRRDYGGADRYGERRRDRYDDDQGDRRGFGSGFRRDEQHGGYNREDRYGYSRSDRQGSRESSKEAPKERPKLNLQPRSKPVENDGAPGAPSAPKLNLQPRSKPVETESAPRSEKSSIFGSAKPVDTAAREREIEQRLQREREDERRHLEEEKENRNLHSNPHESSSSRPRRDSDRSQDGSSSTGRQRRLSSGSSGKGARTAPPPITSPNRSRRESEISNHSEVFSGNEEAPSEEPKSPVSPSMKDEPPAKLVPAPPPAVNVWEKRKTENKPGPGTSPPSQNSSPSSSTTSPSQSKSNSSPQTNQTTPPNAWSKDRPVLDRKTDNKPSESNRENPWFKNKPHDSQNKPANAVVNTRDIQGEAIFDVAAVASGRGRFPGDTGESSDRGHGHGGRGGRGRGDHKSRHPREKHIPKSIEDMPKYETTPKKDWSDSNKYAGLLDDEDDGDNEN